VKAFWMLLMVLVVMAALWLTASVLTQISTVLQMVGR